MAEATLSLKINLHELGEIQTIDATDMDRIAASTTRNE
jgi:hypothetical protein